MKISEWFSANLPNSYDGILLSQNTLQNCNLKLKQKTQKTTAFHHTEYRIPKVLSMLTKTPIKPREYYYLCKNQKVVLVLSSSKNKQTVNNTFKWLKTFHLMQQNTYIITYFCELYK
jgi:hypothetical protein